MAENDAPELNAMNTPWTTCDWGDCDGSTVGYRNDRYGHGWLPVCQRHYDQEPDDTKVAKFVARADLAAPDAAQKLHFEFVLNASATACGIDDDERRLPRTRLNDPQVVDCPDCQQVLVGYKMGRADAVRQARRETRTEKDAEDAAKEIV